MNPLLQSVVLIAILTGPANASTPPAADDLNSTRDAAGTPTFTVTAAPGEGFTVKSDDGKFSSTIKARVQLRETYSHVNRTDTNEPQVRTVRLGIAGNVLAPDVKYLIQLAFGGGDFDSANPSPLFDAYVEYTALRDLNIRIGQFFVPFDRARAVREFALQFVAQGRQLGGGVNLYLNGHAFKFQSDYFYIFGREGDARHVARLQFDATF